MSIASDNEIRFEIEKIKTQTTRRSRRFVFSFGLLFFIAYVIPIYANNEVNFTAMSAFFAIIGASALWWESNHADYAIIPDFANLTWDKNLTIPGIGWIIGYALASSVGLVFGAVLQFGPNYRAFGLNFTKSVLVTSAIVAVCIVGWIRLKRSSYKFQELILIDVNYIKDLKEGITEPQLEEADRRIRRASKLSRNALRSIGFFFLFLSGCFVLIDELIKLWPNLCATLQGSLLAARHLMHL